MYVRLLFVSLIFSISYSLQSQEYEVVEFKKMSSNLGGFMVDLQQEDWFGYAVVSIGDLNNDGANDIAVSALKDDDGGLNRGAVYILFLNADNTIENYQKISDVAGDFTGELQDWDIFGSSLEYLGDLNGDGRIELGVGAEYDGDGGYWHGALWILSLNDDGTVFSHVKISDTEGNFLAPLGDEDVFGTDVETLGDFNGDGTIDLAVSARRDPDGGSDRGAVYILFMNSDLTVQSYQKISDTQGNFQGELEGADYFGGSVCNIGDLDGDGVIDLAVGAYRDDDGGLNRGAVYILFLNADGTVREHQKISNTEGNLEEEFNDEMFFGKSISLSRDINEDGLTEILVGARGYALDQGPNFGAFYLLNLNSDGTVNASLRYTFGFQNFTGAVEVGDSFGFSVSYFSNLYASDSILVGAFSDNEEVFEEGSAWILELGEILSINSFTKNDKLSLFPNPTKKKFLISNMEEVVAVKVFDLSGRQVLSCNAIQESGYDVSYLPIATYIIAVEMNDGTVQQFKLIKG